jgi:hypothetical protein
MVNVDAIATSLRCSHTGCRCNASISKGQRLVHCPAHSNDDPSLPLKEDEGKVLFHCFAGCSPSAVMAALRARGLWTSRETNDGKDRQLITVESLAQAKALPSEFLRGLGLHDLPGEGVGIPYPDGRGHAVVKKRTSLIAKWGSFWPKGQPLMPYGLNRLEGARQAGELTLVEGESDCWTLWYRSLPALGIPGANATKVLQAAHLEGIDQLYVVQEPDQAGNQFVQGVAQRLLDVGWLGEARVIRPPVGIKDVNHWFQLDPSGFKTAWLEALTNTEPLPPPQAKAAALSKPSRLLALAQRAGAKFFRDAESGDYFVAPHRNGSDVWPLESQETCRWLARLCMKAEGSPISRESIKDILFTLGALVQEIDIFPLSVRVAWQDGVLWYDLGGAAVRISDKGWSIDQAPPILFKRFPHQLPQVRPIPGSLSTIDRYLPLDVKSDEIILLKTWLLAGLSPDGPRPLLDLAGPQGSGKSSLARLLKRILDPSRVPTVHRLADLRDLQQQLAQTWALFADNLSGIGPETSDLLAAAITGDATFRRKLYTNADAHIFVYRRVLCVNAISHTAERPDLLDRTLLITLQRITPERRREESTYWQDFEADLPPILGGACDILSQAAALLPQVKLPATPRMADFARWGYAIAEAAGWGGPRFLSAYQRNIDRQHQEAVAASAVAQAKLEFMGEREEWEGPATDLKQYLDPIARDTLGLDPTQRHSGWPQDAARLSKEVFRLAETLAANGIQVSRGYRGKGRSLHLKRCDRPVGGVGSVVPDVESADGDSSAPDSTVGVTDGCGGQRQSCTDSADATDSKNPPFSRGWREEL